MEEAMSSDLLTVLGLIMLFGMGLGIYQVGYYIGSEDRKRK